MPDLVDRLGPAIDHLPLPAGDVPEVPEVVEAPDLRAAHDEGLVGRIGEHRSATELGKGLSAVAAVGAADGDVERHRFAARPAAVVGTHLVAVADDRHRVGSEFVELAQAAQREDRPLADTAAPEQRSARSRSTKARVADVLAIRVRQVDGRRSRLARNRRKQASLAPARTP